MTRKEENIIKNKGIKGNLVQATRNYRVIKGLMIDCTLGYVF